MTLKNNRAPLLSNIKLYASFHQHMWIQTGVTVRKLLSWVMTSVTLTFDLWPWPFAWTLRRSLVITPESFMMIRWWEHSQKGVTDRRTDGQTDRRTENTICRAAWSQLKIHIYLWRYHYTAQNQNDDLLMWYVWINLGIEMKSLQNMMNLICSVPNVLQILQVGDDSSAKQGSLHFLLRPGLTFSKIWGTANVIWPIH